MLDGRDYKLYARGSRLRRHKYQLKTHWTVYNCIVRCVSVKLIVKIELATSRGMHTSIGNTQTADEAE